MLDIWVLLISVMAAHLRRKLRFEPAILVLALALGPILERSIRGRRQRIQRVKSCGNQSHHDIGL